MLGCVLKDGRSLAQFHEKSALSGHNSVRSSKTSEHAIDWRDFALFRRNKTPLKADMKTHHSSLHGVGHLELM